MPQQLLQHLSIDRSAVRQICRPQKRGAARCISQWILHNVHIYRLRLCASSAHEAMALSHSAAQLADLPVHLHPGHMLVGPPALQRAQQHLQRRTPAEHCLLAYVGSRTAVQQHLQRCTATRGVSGMLGPSCSSRGSHLQGQAALECRRPAEQVGHARLPADHAFQLHMH